MTPPTYIGHILEQVNLVTQNCGPILLFGENIDTGSKIGGLARGLKVSSQGRIQNVGNCELTHCGVGLGMMIDGGQSVLFAKQLDFMLLGLDQICNTFNFVRAYKAKEAWGSFTIFCIVCDQGMQGPQSSLNSVGDFASLANIPAYCLNGADDSHEVVSSHFSSPGFRLICLSQRMFGSPVLEHKTEWVSHDKSIFRYSSGENATIVNFNFSLPNTLSLNDELISQGMRSDVFHVNFVPGADLSPIVESCSKTGRLVVVDDSKTVTKFGDSIISELTKLGLQTKYLPLFRRGCLDADYGANPDQFKVDYKEVHSFLKS